MPFPSKTTVDAWKRDWTDRHVTVRPGVRTELARFEGKTGRVVTVSYSGRVIVEFGDGSWVDIENFDEVLIAADPVQSPA